MSKANEDIVSKYLLSFGTSSEEDMNIYRTFLAEDVQYFSGTTMIRSREDVVAFSRRAVDGLGLNSWRAEILNISSADDNVMVERIDYQINNEGEEILPTPIMGIFKVRDGKIAEWRDYWDVRPMLEYGAKYRAAKGVSGSWGDAAGAAAAAAAAAKS